MDLFSRTSGPSYVPAFAARLLLGMARGIQRAPAPIQSAFRDEDFGGMWFLGLILVQWYADALPPAESQDVTRTLAGLQLGPMAAQLNLFRERLTPFVRTAHEAQGEPQLAAAGVYFVAAVDAIGLGTLSAALQAVKGAGRAQAAVTQVLPPPGLRERFERDVAQGASQPAGQRPRMPSRSERFDRADFTMRPAPARAERPSAAGASAAATPPPTPPTPVLDDAAVARAYLHTLGWDGRAVDRLMAGPTGARKERA